MKPGHTFTPLDVVQIPGLPNEPRVVLSKSARFNSSPSPQYSSPSPSRGKNLQQQSSENTPTTPLQFRDTMLSNTPLTLYYNPRYDKPADQSSPQPFHPTAVREKIVTRARNPNPSEETYNFTGLRMNATTPSTYRFMETSKPAKKESQISCVSGLSGVSSTQGSLHLTLDQRFVPEDLTNPSRKPSSRKLVVKPLEGIRQKRAKRTIQLKRNKMQREGSLQRLKVFEKSIDLNKQKLAVKKMRSRLFSARLLMDESMQIRPHSQVSHYVQRKPLAKILCRDQLIFTPQNIQEAFTRTSPDRSPRMERKSTAHGFERNDFQKMAHSSFSGSQDSQGWLSCFHNDLQQLKLRGSQISSGSFPKLLLQTKDTSHTQPDSHENVSKFFTEARRKNKQSTPHLWNQERRLVKSSLDRRIPLKSECWIANTSIVEGRNNKVRQILRQRIPTMTPDPIQSLTAPDMRPPTRKIVRSVLLKRKQAMMRASFK